MTKYKKIDDLSGEMGVPGSMTRCAASLMSLLKYLSDKHNTVYIGVAIPDVVNALGGEFTPAKVTLSFGLLEHAGALSIDHYDHDVGETIYIKFNKKLADDLIKSQHKAADVGTNSVH